jgi:predicted alpha/beta-hydrolase family hydrolase
MLFVQGERDPFGTPGELGPILARLEPPGELLVVDGGDHSLAVPRRAQPGQAAVDAAVQEKVATWLAQRTRPR